MDKSEVKPVILDELFLDKDGKMCKKEDAVKVYARLSDVDGKYIAGRMIALK